MSLRGHSLRVVDGVATLGAMGAWCGAYCCLHQGVYALSHLVCPRRETSGVDKPNAKYFGTSLRRVSTARVVALTHAIASWFWSVRVLGRAWPALRHVDGAMLRYDLHNDAAAVAFMRHSLGYFVQELAHVLRFEPDAVFVAHHVLYLASTFPICALTERGWPLIAVATLLAEVTNPLQLSWEMAKAFGRSDLYDRLSLPFTLAFFLCRGVLMPVFMADMARFLLFSGQAHPDPVLKSTYAVFLGGLAASLVWLVNLLRGFRRYRAKREESEGKGKKRR